MQINCHVLFVLDPTFPSLGYICLLGFVMMIIKTLDSGQTLLFVDKLRRQPWFLIMKPDRWFPTCFSTPECFITECPLGCHVLSLFYEALPRSIRSPRDLAALGSPGKTDPC